MQLLMYLEEELIDTVKVTRVGSAAFWSYCIQGDMQALAKKHQPLIEASGGRPAFLLSGVPSSMNHFQPLRR